MYKFNARIRYSECAEDGKLSLEGLLDYFQDVSTFHSEDLGIGTGYLFPKGLAWVLNMWQIDIERYPKLGDNVDVCTHPYGFKGFIGYRNFCMLDPRGDYYAKANSIWTLLNMETGKPVMPDDLMKERYVCEEKLEMEYLPRKIALPEEGLALDSLVITRQHLDSNHHVNNGQYVRMALDLLGEELTGKVVKRLRAEYKMQARLGDEIYPVKYSEEGKALVALCDENGNPYAVVEIATQM